MLNLGPYSTKEFPNIRVYPTIIDRILEGVAVLLAIAAWVCAIWVYIHIEDKITANFSFMAAGLGTLCLLLVGISAYLPNSLDTFSCTYHRTQCRGTVFYGSPYCSYIECVSYFTFPNSCF